MLKQKTKSKGLKMKKIVLTATALLSLFVFTACEQSPTEVTVQVPSTESEYKEVKWIGRPFKKRESSYPYTVTQEIDETGLKTEGIDSVKAVLVQNTTYNFGTENLPICDYIKIKINPASAGSQYGYVAVVYKLNGSNNECVQYLGNSASTGYGYAYGPLQWEYK